MADSSKLRMQMGCGEPLRSRALVTRPLRNQRQKTPRPGSQPPGARGDRCKP